MRSEIFSNFEKTASNTALCMCGIESRLFVNEVLKEVRVWERK